MTQGAFIYGSRPKTKAQLKTTVDQINAGKADPYAVVIEATSLFGNEFDGSLAEALRTDHLGPFYIVGPDPHTKRNWYASITYDNNTKKWKVK